MTEPRAQTQRRRLNAKDLAKILDDHESRRQDADLSNADLRAADLTGRRLSFANLQGADLTGAELTQTDLMYADLRGVVITPDQVLKAKNWLLASWSRDVLQALRLPDDHNERITGYDVPVLVNEAFFERRVGKLNFTGYDLADRDLRGSYLEEANLTDADVRGAQLNGTSLYGAILEKADLRHVDLSGVLGLTRVQVESARTDSTTVLPAYLQRQLDFGSNRIQIPTSP